MIVEKTIEKNINQTGKEKMTKKQTTPIRKNGEKPTERKKTLD